MNQYPDFDQKLYDDLRRGKEYAFAAVFERYNRLLYLSSTYKCNFLGADNKQ